MISRSHLTGVTETEAVLTGGWLDASTVLQDLTIINGKKFCRLQKASPPLCAFLTGKHPRECPLKAVLIFTQMKERMQKHCNDLMAVAAETLATSEVHELAPR